VTPRALVCGAAFVLVTCAQAPAPSPAPKTITPPSGPFSSRSFPAQGGRGGRPRFTPPPQRASFGLATEHNAFVVNVFSFGKKFQADPSKLHFTLLSQDRPGAPAVPLAAKVEAPALVRSFDQAQPPGTMTVYDVPFTVPAPARAGMYLLIAKVDPGFARYDDGTELSPGAPTASAAVYWPDEAGTDPGLQRARAQLVNRTVYGFGGIVLSCGGASFKMYLADVGVMVRGVERQHGTIEREWTGTMSSRGNDSAFWFFAVDSLAVKADYPSAHEFGTGGSSEPAGDAPCPGFTFADPWHVDISVTTLPPPSRLPAGYDQFKIAVGMTRAEVARRRGYPQGYSTRAALDAQTEWDYEDAPMDSYSVTFRNGRVSAYTVPVGLP
jgi:hypothetical protein